MWGGHFLIFLALVAAVVFIMMLPFEIFTHTHTHTHTQTNAYDDGERFILNHCASEISAA